MNKNLVLITIIIVLLVTVLAGGAALFFRASTVKVNNLPVDSKNIIPVDSSFKNQQIDLIQTNQEYQVLVYSRAVSGLHLNLESRLFVYKNEKDVNTVTTEKIIQKCKGELVQNVSWLKPNAQIISCPLFGAENFYYVTIKGKNFFNQIGVLGISLSKETALKLLETAYLDFEKNMNGQEKIPFSDQTFTENIQNNDKLDFLFEQK